MWPMISLHMNVWCSVKRPLKASSSWGSLERRRYLAIWARTLGSRSPAISASIMALDDWDHTVEATEVSLMWSRTGARCQHLGRSVSPARSPNRTCDFHRIRLSTSPMLHSPVVIHSSHGVGIFAPR